MSGNRSRSREPPNRDRGNGGYGSSNPGGSSYGGYSNTGSGNYGSSGSGNYGGYGGGNYGSGGSSNSGYDQRGYGSAGGSGYGAGSGSGQSGYGYGGSGNYGASGGYGGQDRGYGGYGGNGGYGSGSQQSAGYGGRDAGYNYGSSGGNNGGYGNGGASGYGGGYGQGGNSGYGSGAGYGSNYGDRSGGYGGRSSETGHRDSYGQSGYSDDRKYGGHGGGGQQSSNQGSDASGYGGYGQSGSGSSRDYSSSYGNANTGYGRSSGDAQSQYGQDYGKSSGGQYGGNSGGSSYGSGGYGNSGRSNDAPQRRSRSRSRDRAGRGGFQRDRGGMSGGRGDRSREYGARGGGNESGPGSGMIAGTGYEESAVNVRDDEKATWEGACPEIADEIEGEERENFQICVRPSTGTLGKSISVKANYFRLHLEPSVAEYFKYHCEVAPTNAGSDHYGPSETNESERMEDVAPARTPAAGRPRRPLPKSKVRKVINAALTQYADLFANVTLVHDGMAAVYSNKRLSDDTVELTDVDLNPPTNPRPANPSRPARPPPTFVVKLKFVETVDMVALQDYMTNPTKKTPQTAIQALDVALRHLCAQKFISAGSNLFSLGSTKRLNSAIDVCWGYHQSVRLTQQSLFLNLDVTAGLFYSACQAEELAVQILNKRSVNDLQRLSARDLRELKRGMRKLEFEWTHLRNGKPRVCFEVHDLPASEITFERKINGTDQVESVTVEAYFRERYDMRLRYPFLPCLAFGSKRNPNYVPMEVCRLVPGQKCPGNVADQYKAEMVRECNQKPQQRLTKVEDQFHANNYSNDRFIRDFGIHLDKEMVDFTARQLDTPTVLYSNCSETPRSGSWNLRDKQFIDGAELSSWAVLNLARNVRPDSVRTFIREVSSMSRQCGLNVKNQEPFVLDQQQAGVHVPVEELMKECAQQAERSCGGRCQIIFVIKSDATASDYAEIKRVSDTILGIPSQCVLSKNILKNSKQYYGNLCLKINMKLGGKNSMLKNPIPIVSDVPTMVIGASVTHPRKTNARGPALASLVTSLDKMGCKHAARVGIQKEGAENIMHLPEMLCSLFMEFYKSTNRKPEKIIFYRTGVSDGFYEETLNTEMHALKLACRTMSPDFNPLITYCVVTRRHHTRCFGKNNLDRSGNLMPGTIVDKTITSTHYYDFYLYGHSGIQGTSVPARYTVLYDENNMSPDDMQTMTYNLCFNFTRCTRSVSIVATLYYAELLATRARMFLYDSSDRASEVSGHSMGGSMEMAPIHRDLCNIMFYV